MNSPPPPAAGSVTPRCAQHMQPPLRAVPPRARGATLCLESVELQMWPGPSPHPTPRLPAASRALAAPAVLKKPCPRSLWNAAADFLHLLAPAACRPCLSRGDRGVRRPPGSRWPWIPLTTCLVVHIAPTADPRLPLTGPCKGRLVTADITNGCSIPAHVWASQLPCPVSLAHGARNSAAAVGPAHPRPQAAADASASAAPAWNSARELPVAPGVPPGLTSLTLRMPPPPTALPPAGVALGPTSPNAARAYPRPIPGHPLPGKGAAPPFLHLYTMPPRPCPALGAPSTPCDFICCLEPRSASRTPKDMTPDHRLSLPQLCMRIPRRPERPRGRPPSPVALWDLPRRVLCSCFIPAPAGGSASAFLSQARAPRRFDTAIPPLREPRPARPPERARPPQLQPRALRHVRAPGPALRGTARAPHRCAGARHGARIL
jgi:hypothetical protein